MNQKNQILDSWKLVEHLSEGDINLREKEIRILDGITEGNYFDFFQEKLDSREIKNQGIILYCGIYDKTEVGKYLRGLYKLPDPEEQMVSGKNFEFALVFNNDLKLDVNQTFIPASTFILKKHSDPINVEFENKFHEYDSKRRELYRQRFSEDDGKKYSKTFNEAIKTIFAEEEVTIDNCRYRFISMTNPEAANLHSPYIHDLENAKESTDEMLTNYILGRCSGDRQNLDSKNTSANYNPELFKEILSPEMFPLGRFPSGTAYPLYFMQQVAVNLIAKYSNSQIQSVNGPPGTGKTTLLRDIFAELIIRQAKNIVGLKEPLQNIEYNSTYNIAQLPQNIIENSIIVASSNNGAVQNIVQEIPLIKTIDKGLVGQLTEADYFYRIANSTIKKEFDEDETGKPTAKLTTVPFQEEKYWGLLSLEGGRKSNVDNLINNVEAAYNCLKDEYESQEDVYQQFEVQYQRMTDIRKSVAKYFKLKTALKKAQDDYAVYHEEYEKEKEKRNTAYEDFLQKADQTANEINDSLSMVSDELKSLDAALDIQEDLKKGQKKGGLGLLFKNSEFKRERKERLAAIQDQIVALKKQKSEKSIEQFALREKQQRLKKEKSEKEKVNIKFTKEYELWEKKSKQTIRELSEQLAPFEDMANEFSGIPLDLDQEYDNLQKTGFCFNENFRIEQSKLFVLALKVRKEFLYQNKSSIKGATIIWNSKVKPSNHLAVLSAWNWINMVVPVISTTFFSLPRMLKDIGEKELGYIIIDEAGQAVPQAAVGAMYRCRHAVVVGDPSQIEPVSTIDPSVHDIITNHFLEGLDSSKYISESASVQTLADAASNYGFYTESAKSENSWIGLPLWVHRRCANPMFSIANVIAYHNNMVLENSNEGKSIWYDVSGTVNDKYVKEQGELVKNLLVKGKNDPSTDWDSTYVITPFRNVAKQLVNLLKTIDFVQFDNGKPTNVGTVHTFQGKEAKAVFLVLGADVNSKSAAAWAVKKPNLMNVAATRAKCKFYIIGDLKLYEGLGSPVINETIKIIRSQGGVITAQDIKLE